MLKAYPQSHGASLSGAAWVDLIDPTEQERAAFEKSFGLRVPTQEALGEIETTSRLRIEDETLYLTAPLILVAENKPWMSAPTGFVLAKNVLLTVRYANSPAFDAVAKEVAQISNVAAPHAYARLLEELVDRLADLLESTSRDLDDISLLIFRGDDKGLAHETVLLREVMVRTGRISARMARIHYTLVCLDRMAKFTAERAHEWIPRELCDRLRAVSSDIGSLVQFAEDLVSRVQLLQDAATGIISVAQNEVMKVLTIASVVGIPPVLVVGIYGMNFKNMPELNWAWGYPYALTLIVLSALLPLIWFKWRDWI